MDKTWPLQDAKARFSEVVERASHGEPQIVTKHGQNTVAIISYQEYSAWKAERTTLFEALVPKRGVLEEDEAEGLFARPKAGYRAVELE